MIISLLSIEGIRDPPIIPSFVLMTFCPCAPSLVFEAYKNLYIKHVDCETAFLNDESDLELYVQQPEGFASQKHSGSLQGRKSSTRRKFLSLDNLRGLNTSLVRLLDTYVAMYVDTSPSDVPGI